MAQLNNIEMENRDLCDKIKSHFRLSIKPKEYIIEITNLLLRIHKIGSNKRDFEEDLSFVNIFYNEIKDRVNRDEENGQLIFTKSGYYRLWNSELKRMKGVEMANKFYIDNVLNKQKLERIKKIINLYFTGINGFDEPVFEVIHTKNLLGKDFRGWEMYTMHSIVCDEDFNYLLNKYLP